MGNESKSWCTNEYESNKEGCQQNRAREDFYTKVRV